MPKVGSMFHIWAQNQLFKLFSIILDDKHLKVGKNDYFGFWVKIHIRLKMG